MLRAHADHWEADTIALIGLIPIRLVGQVGTCHPIALPPSACFPGRAAGCLVTQGSGEGWA